MLEAWEQLEGQEIGNPEGDRAETAERSETTGRQEVKRVEAEKRERLPDVSAKRAEPEKPVVQREEAAPKEQQAVEDLPEEQPAQPKSQPMLTDFGLYKCGVCGKMVMGYEKGNHVKEIHNGQESWKLMRK